MKIFKEFLLEEKNASIPHLRHLAGESHFYGSQETSDELNRLQELHKHLSGENSKVESISMKADGSPSFNMGYVTDPTDNDTKFGVAYKGAAKGYAFSHNDVDRIFAGKEHLQSKMHQLLEHGHKVVRPHHGLIQGDFMGSKEDNTINEEGDKLHFQENTLKYGIDKKSDEGKALKKAKISVALHTRIDPEHQKYNLDPNGFQQHEDVHVFNNRVTHDPNNYSDVNRKLFENNFNKAKEHISNIPNHNDLVFGMTDHLQTYINQTVSKDTTPTVQGFRQHVSDRLEKPIEKVKTPAAKERKREEKRVALQHIDENKQHFGTLFKAHKHLDTAKNLLTDALDQSPQTYEHEIKGNPSKPEGYVVKYKGSNSLDNVVKVVNRGEFSRHNFADE